MKVNDKISEFILKNQLNDTEYENNSEQKFILDKDI